MKIVQKTTLYFLFIPVFVFLSCGWEVKKDVYVTHGRTDVVNDTIVLIGSASSVTLGFKGSSCSVSLQSQNKYNHHGYIVVEVDGQYQGRYKVVSGGTVLPVNASGKGKHTVSLYKATEAANGDILFLGAEGDLFKVTEKPKKKIEFIGDSITCGMGNDIEEIPCDTGEWFDQHNAYYSYAPIAARGLKANYLLSSVSGIGMYRNWNDEHDKEAIMPDVYEKLYLQKGTTTPFKGYGADVTCIALGTNDFSEGDGKKERLPFNEDKYVANYINFVNTVYKYSPDTQVVLLNSPMVEGEKNATFIKCLNRVKDAINKQSGHKEIKVFTFSAVTPHGCGYHPKIEDDKKMASQLVPFLKKLL